MSLTHRVLSWCLALFPISEDLLGDFVLLQEARQLAVAEGLEGDAVKLLEMLQRMLPKAAIVAPETESSPYSSLTYSNLKRVFWGANYSERTVVASVLQ